MVNGLDVSPKHVMGLNQIVMKLLKIERRDSMVYVMSKRMYQKEAEALNARGRVVSHMHKNDVIKYINKAYGLMREIVDIELKG